MVSSLKRETNNYQSEWMGSVALVCLVLSLSVPLFTLKYALGLLVIAMTFVFGMLQIVRGDRKIQRSFALIAILLGSFLFSAVLVTFGVL